MSTLREIVENNYRRMKSAGSRADIVLIMGDGRFTAYCDDAEKIGEWLDGTGIGKLVDLTGEPWFDPLWQIYIPLAQFDRAMTIIREHASVILVDTIMERNVPQVVPFLFLTRTRGIVATPRTAPAEKEDPLASFW